MESGKVLYCSLLVPMEENMNLNDSQVVIHSEELQRDREFNLRHFASKAKEAERIYPRARLVLILVVQDDSVPRESYLSLEEP